MGKYCTLTNESECSLLINNITINIKTIINNLIKSTIESFKTTERNCSTLKFYGPNNYFNRSSVGKFIERWMAIWNY